MLPASKIHTMPPPLIKTLLSPCPTSRNVMVFLLGTAIYKVRLKIMPDAPQAAAFIYVFIIFLLSLRVILYIPYTVTAVKP